jgi:four helix bundle protein
MSELLPRTRCFALQCLQVADGMSMRLGARAVSSQLARSATSVAANYRAARRGRSKAEFLSKLQIALEEADESHFWLGMAVDGGYVHVEKVQYLIREADELTAMLVASLKTARRGSSPNQRL